MLPSTQLPLKRYMGPWEGPILDNHWRGSRLGPHGPMEGPNLSPSWAGLKFRPSWAHEIMGGLKFGPSWAYGEPKRGPIMGGDDALIGVQSNAIGAHRRVSWPAAEYDYIIPSGPIYCAGLLPLGWLLLFQAP